MIFSHPCSKMSVTVAGLTESVVVPEMKSSDAGNFYGSTTRVESSDDRDEAKIPRQTFSITEPSYNELRENGARNGQGLFCCGGLARFRDQTDKQLVDSTPIPQTDYKLVKTSLFLKS